MRKLDNIGSIVPLFIVIFIIVFAGIMIGILGTILTPIMDTSNSINSIFAKFWFFIPIMVLIVLIFYAIVKGQRGG